MGVVVPQQAAGQSPFDAFVTNSGKILNAKATTGQGTALNVNGMATVLATISTTGFTGAMTFQVSEDGTNYTDVLGYLLGGSTIDDDISGLTTDTSVYVYQIGVSGAQFFNINVTSRSAGSVTATAHATPAPGNVIPANVSISAVTVASGGIASGAVASGALVDGAISRAAGVTVLASAAHDLSSASYTSSDINTPFAAKGVRVVFDVTDVTNSPSLILTIKAKDGASGKYTTLLAGAAVTTDTTNTYVVYPTITAVANSIAQTAIGDILQIVIADSANKVSTFSIGLHYLY